jgi:hypothetical protein
MQKTWVGFGFLVLLFISNMYYMVASMQDSKERMTNEAYTIVALLSDADSKQVITSLLSLSTIKGWKDTYSTLFTGTRQA